jgi:DNA polymerase V
MRILKQELDKVDVYSIDEAFIDIKTLPKNEVEEILLKVRKKILQWTGIPVSIGIGSTKTLAKAANEFAKKNHEYGGVFFIKNESTADEMLKKIDVSSVWGIGRKWSQKLISCGIDNAYKLKTADKNFVETRLNIMGKRTILELNGYSCVQITDIHATRKTILSSRSFGRSVFDFKDLSEAVSQYISIASRKLREHHLMASTVLTFVKTNHHKKEEKQYSAFYESTLESPSDFTPDLVKQAHYNLGKVYKKGYRYKKAGILLTGLIPKSDNIRTFFSKNYSTTKKNDRLMRMVDILNNKWGKDVLKIGSEGIKKRWRMKSEMRSDPYTSDWHSLLTIKI